MNDQLKNTILVVDDDPVITSLLVEDLPGCGFQVLSCGTCEEARGMLKEKPVDAILLDHNLPDGKGSDFFRSMKGDLINVPVIFITNFPDVEMAVSLMKEGAADYIIKPFSVSAVAERLKRVLEVGVLRSEVAYYRRRALPVTGRHDLIGSSDAMRAVRSAIEEAVGAPMTPVLLSGETGTGKEVVARLIHQGCHGATNPFVEVDCATIPKNLFESELFGHERGAFTSADRAKEGIFEFGKSGTIFMDEVGEIDLELQSRLLRVLETRQFRRVGGTRPLTFGARVIAATNRDLHALVRQKEFRADLYYRVAVYQIEIPPLRERAGDVPELADYFLRQAEARHHKSVSGFTAEFSHKLQLHAFPGNVRELRNLVEQAVIHSRGGEAEIVGFVPEEMPLPVPAPLTSSADVRMSEAGGTLREHERSVIESALRDNHGNKSAAARQLGISRPALLRRMSKVQMT